MEIKQLKFELKENLILVKSAPNDTLLAKIRKSALTESDWALVLKIMSIS